MSIKKLRIATRKSPLALWQTDFVKSEIQKVLPKLEIEIIGITTIADKMLSTPLSKIGGKGLFVKELETALLENKADIAVHSIKDMPMDLPAGLSLSVVCKRDDPRDVFVSNRYEDWSKLPANAIVGTSSLRRRAQLLALRPDLQIKDLRGNVGTRLKKLDDKEFDAIILAAAGLKRLAEESRINVYFATNEMLPAAGQGAIGIECRENDPEIHGVIAHLEDAYTRFCVMAERRVTTNLGGSCQAPIAAFAQIHNDTIRLTGLVGNLNGQRLVKSQQTAKFSESNILNLGDNVANDLILQGAQTILDEVLNSKKDDA